MQIPIQLIVPSHTMKAVNTHALVDSGADISCIDWDFVKKHWLPTTKLETPIWAQNVDNSYNKKEDILYTCTLFLNVEGIALKTILHVMACGWDNVILGLPWLKAANPSIDWKNRTLSLDKSIDQSAELYFSFAKDTDHHNNHYWKPPPWIPRHVNVDAITDSRLYQYNDWEEESQYIARAINNQNIYQIICYGSQLIPAGSLLIARLTTATELAMAAKKTKPKVTLPPKYTEFTSVFSKEAADHVSPSQPYNHEINLDESFVPKIEKIYPLSPDEQKATEDFLDENLRSGKIHPSNSPQASPFFFVKKKDGNLHPCQDYWYLNEHTIHNAYPLPLISNLID